MKKGLKFVVATFLFAIIFNSSAMAQRSGNNGERPSPEERAEKKLNKLTKKLELNDYQVDQLKNLNEDFISQVGAIRNGDLEREQKREKIKALKDGMQNETKALLDAAQLEKFEKMLARKEANRGKKGEKGKRSHPKGNK